MCQSVCVRACVPVCVCVCVCERERERERERDMAETIGPIDRPAQCSFECSQSLIMAETIGPHY